MKRFAFPLTIILLMITVVALAAPGDKRPAVTSAAIGLGTNSSATMASVTATTSVTAPAYNSTAADGYHYVLPYNSIAFAGTPLAGMIQTTPTGPQWYTGSAWEAIGSGGGGTWGSITGTLSAQTDLQAALDAITAGGITISTAIPTTPGAANLNDSTHILTVASSTGYTQFTGSFTAWDTTPDAFAFTDETDIALSTAKTSNAITVAGINSAAAISVTGDTGYGYSKNSAACTTTSGTVVAGDTVAACVTSSGSNSTATTATITIGGVSDTYSVTTVAAASETLVYEEAGTAAGFTNAYSWVGGRYNPTGTEQIVKVSAYITSKTGSPTSDVYARIYPISAITDNFHATLDYASVSGKSAAVASTSMTAPGWVEFTFSAPVSITNSTNGYAIVFGPDTTDYNNYITYANSATEINSDGYFSNRWNPATGAYVTGVEHAFSMRIYKQ